MSSQVREFSGGWVPDTPDIRDTYQVLSSQILEALPPVVDLRANESMKFPIFDQGQLGSCTANAISAAVTFAYYKQKSALKITHTDNSNNDNHITIENPFYIGSRLFIYYNERVMENSINSDAGAMIRDGIKSINRKGVCKETPTWPYDINKFTQKPSNQAYQEAMLHQALQYRRIDNTNIDNLKGCLSQGFPFVFGFTVYSSFMTAAVAKTGIMPMPAANERVMGGHAVLGVGYDDNKKLFTVRNSWGQGWGDQGYFYMPYDYITNSNLCDDFWNVTMMEAEKINRKNNKEERR